MVGKKDVAIICLGLVVVGLVGYQGIVIIENNAYVVGANEGVAQYAQIIKQTALTQGYLDIQYQDGNTSKTERFWAETIIQQQLQTQALQAG